MLNKIKDRKVSISILVGIILVLILICAFVLFFEVNGYRRVKSELHQFYYYFTATRIDFEGNVVLDKSDKVLSLQNNNITINSSPIYYKEYKDEVLLPENMEIVYPYKNNPMYKVGKFSKVYLNKNYLYINSEAGIGRLYDCFFYDGEDLYFFVEDTSLIINDERYELSPFSFVEVTKTYIRIYNYETEEYIFLDSYSGSVGAYTEEYAVNLIEDSLTYKSKFYMLIKSVDALDFAEF